MRGNRAISGCAAALLAATLLAAPLAAKEEQGRATGLTCDQRHTFILRLEIPPGGGSTAGADAAAAARRAETAAAQDRVLAAAGRRLGRPLAIAYRYIAALNGLALALSEDEAREVANLPEVAGVHRSVRLRPASDAGPAWAGAPGVWDGTQTGGLPGTQGEGVVIGIVDSGVDPLHPSFADVGGDGHDHDNPRGPGNYLGWCDQAHPRHDPSLSCNDKLIGIWVFPEDAAEPMPHSHGTQMASIAAGNHVSATMTFPTTTITRTLSGVAPHANVVVYDVCAPFCSLEHALAGIDQAILDGVDVLNFSLEIDPFFFGSPWAEPFALAFLAARDAGVFVSTILGSGFAPRGSTAPWTLTVGKSTHDRVFTTALAELAGGSAAPPPDLEGLAWTGGYGPASIVHAGEHGDPFCSSPFAPGTFSGEIVVCDHGGLGFMDPLAQSGNALVGGAGGAVLANTFDFSVTPAGHLVPAVHLAFGQAQELRAWLSAGTGHTGRIQGTAVQSDPLNGDVVLSGSGGGLGGTIKPDVVAPGDAILAASTGHAEFAVASGTSQSAAFASGAAALLIALHPDWTPSEVHSALMTTAATTLTDPIGPADVFARGAGRIELGAAARAGLVLDETVAAFAAADPELGGDPASLNLPLLACSFALDRCAWTRTVRSTLATASEWMATAAAPPGVSLTVEPASFMLGPGEVQEIEVTADLLTSPPDTPDFSELVLTEVGGQAPPAHLPIAIRWVPEAEVTVDIAGGGGGRVTSSPAGIDCGDDCSERYRQGQQVSLTAIPDPGSQLIRWGAPSFVCFGLSPDVCALTVDFNVSITAYFAPIPPDVELFDGESHAALIDAPTTSDWKYYFIDIGPGAEQLVVDLFTAGSADLYVRFGEKPEFHQWNCWDQGPFVRDLRCSIDSPQPGRWWIGVNTPSWQGPVNYSVRARWQDFGTDFFTVTPCRLLDTRELTPLFAGQPRAIPVTLTLGSCGVPPLASAISANVTVVNATAGGHIRIYPAGAAIPTASTVNFRRGEVRANNAVLPLAVFGEIEALAVLAEPGARVDLIIDVNGYFK